VDAAGRVGSVDGARAFEVRLGLTWAFYLWNTAEDDDARPSSVVGSASR